jgi:hypothetical protein
VAQRSASRASCVRRDHDHRVAPCCSSRKALTGSICMSSLRVDRCAVCHAGLLSVTPSLDSRSVRHCVLRQCLHTGAHLTRCGLTLYITLVAHGSFLGFRRSLVMYNTYFSPVNGLAHRTVKAVPHAVPARRGSRRYPRVAPLPARRAVTCASRRNSRVAQLPARRAVTRASRRYPRVAPLPARRTVTCASRRNSRVAPLPARRAVTRASHRYLCIAP